MPPVRSLPRKRRAGETYTSVAATVNTREFIPSAKSKGFVNAVQIDLDGVRASSDGSCGRTPPALRESYESERGRSGNRPTTSEKISSARSSWERSWVAIRLVRRSAPAGGTAGWSATLV